MSDEHISPLQKVVHAIHNQGSKAGLQLWHVGRKGSLPQKQLYLPLGCLTANSIIHWLAH
ncbi:hypothetical protein MKN04_16865 [Paenibacillus polymyxa]|uniref:oxidoreductase n=1 Tax=Paenibacillus polymyxa TaxID=1406 RepID=UPI000F90F0FB|nr:hypothetical protein [Paenibacillus polymyxa]MCH6189317.1 hypothetical protein [Paenibacillus polymyxa]MDY8094312.1 hypothetical protein [Paenibacillus polymyxa]WRL58496.1 hypothetical protein U3G77_09695 [Paenibacillus polymyxa]